LKFHLLLPLFFTLSFSQAQPRLDKYEDGVYRDYIRSVRLHVNGLALTQPIAALGQMDALFLTFDELDGRGTRYYYTVIHCDRHWQPTQELSQFDYLNGFREGEIHEYDISSGTYQDYLHYFITIPNEEVKWSISGNYLLVVYESGEEDNPILTRRFMVTEDKVKIKSNVVRPVIVAQQNTHQEIDFGVETKELNCSNPRAEFFCSLIQNGRWASRIEDITPRTITGTYLDYNYQGKIVFEAGKEYRNMDISSMIYRSEDVLDIEEYKEGFSTILKPVEPRDRSSYIFRRDLNGMFVPYNRDYTRKHIPPDSLASTLNLVTRYNYREQQLNTDYSEVIVTLKMADNLETDVYVVGGITDWKMLPEYKLTYDDRVGGYVGRLYLKQGYYNYGFAVPDKNGNPDFTFLEGNWYATENQYTLLAYYRPIGGQYDRLVGALTFNSYN
jgi:Domain of unknown function (DUF5103)